MIAIAVPRLVVDRARGRAAIAGGVVATDELMRRVEGGQPFRAAYRAIAAELATGLTFAAPEPREILRRRRSTGGLGNLGLGRLRTRLRAVRAWERRERGRFERALRRLMGARP